jgi:predicted O-linked N-acetylglucosamine transferase (SPINDLY family)
LYLATYHRIDIGLDPLPAHGHTTSLDAFWMGVPVVTKVGSTVLGRAGLCLAENLGLRELVAYKPDEFVAIGVELARDLPRLAELRRELRGKMQRSPLMDGPRFARNLEAAYRFAWTEWCKSDSL